MTYCAPPPTTAETAYLSTLGPASPPHPAVRPLHAELEACLRLCRVPWVADFLFSPDLTSLPTLTAPANLCSAVTAAVTLTNVQCVTSLGSNPFDVHFSGACLFVPAFSVAPLSVGFGVQESNIECFSKWCGPANPGHDPAPLSHFRYVRDDANGVLAIIYHDTVADLIKLEAMMHSSASVRHRTFAVFDHDSFRNAIRSEKGILHPDLLASATHMISSAVESKICPHCASPVTVFCSCPMDVYLPKHPLDFSNLGRNMHAFVGAYEGLSKSTAFEAGKEVMSANVGSVINIQGGVDQDLINKLSSWAITDQLKGKKECPTALIMPSAHPKSNGPDPHSHVIDMAMDDAPLVSSTEPEGSGSSRDVSPDFFDPMANVTSSCSSGSGILIAESLDDTGPQVVPHHSGIVPPLFEHMSPEMSQSGRIDEALDLVNKITCGTSLDMADLDLGRRDTLCFESISSEEQEVPTMDQVALAQDPEQQLHQQTGVNSVVSRMRSIAPSSVPMARSQNADAAQDEKEQRAQLRKQRNREAAQRSNLKRKIKNDTLKNALKESHAKATELRARELALREENLRLRSLTSS